MSETLTVTDALALADLPPTLRRGLAALVERAYRAGYRDGAANAVTDHDMDIAWARLPEVEDAYTGDWYTEHAAPLLQVPCREIRELREAAHA